jgi:hypothetical protein
MYYSAFHFVGRSLVLLWKRLPRIALYTVVLFILAQAAAYAYYYFLPSKHFIDYSSVIVSNAQEGEDVPFSVCREARGNYNFRGFRNILLIPEGQCEEQGVNVNTIEVENNINADEKCKNYYVSKDDYRHRPGMYMLKASLEFEVGPVRKHTSWESNIYTVFPSTDEGVERRIQRLQEQIRELQRQLDELSTRISDDPRSTRLGARVVSSSIAPAPEPRATRPSPQTEPSQVPPSSPQRRSATKRVCDGLERILRSPGLQRLCK